MNKGTIIKQTGKGVLQGRTKTGQQCPAFRDNFNTSGVF